MKQRATPETTTTDCVKEWRGLFNDQILKRASQFLTMHQYEDFDCTDREAHAIIGQGHNMGRALIRNAPASCSDDWDPKYFSCSCLAERYRYTGPGERVTLCVHEAALLMLWERKRGPWRFHETSEESLRRQRREEQKKELKQERIRRKQQQEAEGGIRVDVAPFFPRPEASAPATYFQVRRAMEGRTASLYALNRAKAILREGTVDMSPPEITYTHAGHQALFVSARVSDALDDHTAEVELSADRLIGHTCDCHGYTDDDLCEHELALLVRVREYVDRENPGDATDRTAERFFLEMDAAQSTPDAADSAFPDTVKAPVLSLLPRVVLEWGTARLSFKIGLNGRFIILKDLRELADAAEQERKLLLSKTVRADFATMTFAEDSRRWFDFIRRRISEADLLRDRMRAYSYFDEPAEIRTLQQETLKGAALDRFYETADGTECEFIDRASKFSGMIRVGHADFKLRLTSRRIADVNGAFLGVEVTGALPATIQGSTDLYVLNERYLSKLSREENQALQPFRTAAGSSERIRFLVGRNRLAEFYYRIAPRLMESPYVEFVDNCAQEAETVLPPEPSFLFRIDLEGDCFLEEFVSYGDAELVPLPRRPSGPAGYFDSAQETRVEKVIRRYFPRFDPVTSTYRNDADEDELYRILTEGVPELSRYGEVQGSNAFRKCVIRSVPQIHVGVSVESGLLDISILSKDISSEELLEVLQSYRRKKTFHRLKNGDFLTLSGDDQLPSLDALTYDLNLSAEEIIQGHIELPLFRALYLDTMLEKHHELSADRDRTYRALIRDFRTIRDADYEVPAAQADILRPYQVYGYKWLRTLAAAGFGGILADEMGLGKTLQAITFLQALKESGDPGPALVVCPASLVYNWQEEFQHFAPSMSVLPVAGNATARKAILEEARNGTAHFDAYITSYDLLRQDIASYAQLRFSVMILDEAQYIKNQKAGMTKAVKIVQARTRLALTGTPIENRLAELWSIFDFLMPGFLYSYPEFLRRFETPITKNHEAEPAERLKHVTAPFILRRLKSDVLKDLPPKLEEIRYSRFEDEQRKLYDGQVVRMKRMIAGSGHSGEDRIRIFAELMRIRQICCDPALIFEDYHGGSAKRAACLELIQSAMGGGHKMLIFSQFASMLALLEDDLRKEQIPFYKIIGATPKEERLRLVRAFNEDETPVFLISLKAGGTGLNLTGADVVIHYDPWWNLAAQNQATDRAHRIGQKNQVTVYRMIVKGTIEEKILSMQEAKRDLADAILSGERESLFSLSNEELLDLLN
ncbi:MAG: DEAD/DEAH box helicase [Oscillibacter sp.]|nr:DEAD/DEAH box helicase [Oscillibacter sp.]